MLRQLRTSFFREVIGTNHSVHPNLISLIGRNGAVMNDADRQQAEMFWHSLKEEMDAIVRDCLLLENIESEAPIWKP